MVFLLKSKSYLWLILAVVVVAIFGLAVLMAAKVDPKIAAKPVNLQKGLVLYYSFDTNEGRKVTDLSGRGNHGKVRSGTYVSNGKIGRAMFFNGDGDYIDIRDDPNIQTDVFTLTTWIKTSNTRGVWQTIISFEEQSYAVSVLPNGHVHYGLQGIKRVGEGTSDVRLGEWVFVAVTRDSKDRVSIYVNGVLENSFFCDTHSKFFYSGKIGGEFYGNEYFTGSLDEVRVHNRELSASEVKQLYNLTLGAETAIRSKSLAGAAEDTRIVPDPNEGQVKVSGVVRDEQGKPVPDVLITLLPMGGEEYRTDTNGEFSGHYLLKHAPAKPENTHFYVFARYTGRNLAAAEQIPRGEECKLEIALVDAVMLTGQITDPDCNPIVDAKINVVLCDDHWGGYIDPWGRWKKDNVTIDNKGFYKIKTIPHGCFYEIITTAQGYGVGTTEVGTWDTHKKQINLGKIILPPTNLSVSGTVVDEKGVCVPHANIELEGDRQIHHSPIKADTEGNFTIEKLCEGTITIEAFTEDFSLWGQKNIKAGDKEVEIMVVKTIRACPMATDKTLSLIGKKLPEFKDFDLDVNFQIKDKMVLICFWDVNWQASRHCIRKLVHMYDELRKKDIVVVSVYASKIDKKLVPDLVKKFSIPFAVGMIEGKIEEVQFRWGFDSLSLPWVTLTDQDHIVTDEGFGLQILREQNEEIKASESKR